MRRVDDDDKIAPEMVKHNNKIITKIEISKFYYVLCTIQYCVRVRTR